MPQSDFDKKRKPALEINVELIDNIVKTNKLSNINMYVSMERRKKWRVKESVSR